MVRFVLGTAVSSPSLWCHCTVATDAACNCCNKFPGGSSRCQHVCNNRCALLLPLTQMLLSLTGHVVCLFVAARCLLVRTSPDAFLQRHKQVPFTKWWHSTVFEYLLTHESVAECLNNLADDHDLRLLDGESMAAQSEAVLQGLDGVSPRIGSIIHSMVQQAMGACAFCALSEVCSDDAALCLCLACVSTPLDPSRPLSTSLDLTTSLSPAAPGEPTTPEAFLHRHKQAPFTKWSQETVCGFLLTHESVAECLNSLADGHDLRRCNGEWLATQKEAVLQGLDGVSPRIGSIIHSMVKQAMGACAFCALSEVCCGPGQGCMPHDDVALCLCVGLRICLSTLDHSRPLSALSLLTSLSSKAQTRLVHKMAAGNCVGVSVHQCDRRQVLVGAS